MPLNNQALSNNITMYSLLQALKDTINYIMKIYICIQFYFVSKSTLPSLIVTVTTGFWLISTTLSLTVTLVKFL